MQQSGTVKYTVIYIQAGNTWLMNDQGWKNLGILEKVLGFRYFRLFVFEHRTQNYDP